MVCADRLWACDLFLSKCDLDRTFDGGGKQPDTSTQRRRCGNSTFSRRTALKNRRLTSACAVTVAAAAPLTPSFGNGPIPKISTGSSTTLKTSPATLTINGVRLVSLFGASRLIGFFKLNSPEVIAQAEWYVRIACGLVIFSYLNAILTGLLTAAGNSRTPAPRDADAETAPFPAGLP